jgi:hypothetical protein
MRPIAVTTLSVVVESKVANALALAYVNGVKLNEVRLRDQG